MRLAAIKAPAKARAVKDGRLLRLWYGLWFQNKRSISGIRNIAQNDASIICPKKWYA